MLDTATLHYCGPRLALAVPAMQSAVTGRQGKYARHRQRARSVIHDFNMAKNQDQ